MKGRPSAQTWFSVLVQHKHNSKFLTNQTNNFWNNVLANSFKLRKDNLRQRIARINCFPIYFTYEFLTKFKKKLFSSLRKKSIFHFELSLISLHAKCGCGPTCLHSTENISPRFIPSSATIYMHAANSWHPLISSGDVTDQ